MSYSIGRNALKEFDINRAIYGKFDGLTNYVSVPDNVNLNLVNNFSVEIFFSTKSFTNCELYNRYSTTGSNRQIIIRIVNSTNVRVILSADGVNTSIYDISVPTITLNSLYHLFVIKTTTNIALYLNGVFISNTTVVDTISVSASSYIGGYLFGGSPVFTLSNIYLTRLHNRALSASEVLAYYNQGRPDLYQIPYADRWGSQTELITNSANRDFSSDTGFWTKGTGVTIADNVAHFVDVPVGVNGLLRATLMSTGKQYKLTFTISNFVKGSLTIFFGSTQAVALSANGTYSITMVSSGNNYIYFACGVISTFDIDDVSLVQVGAVADYRFNEGSGYQIKDYSTNKLHGTLNGTYDNFWQNNKQFFTAELTFLHSAISSTAATTTLFKLPANVKIKELITDPTVAFDTDNTISLGISGNDTWLATLTGTNTTTPQYANVDKMYSPNNEVQLYIKKSGASSAGSITLKFRFENMNYKGGTNCNPIL